MRVACISGTVLATGCIAMSAVALGAKPHAHASQIGSLPGRSARLDLASIWQESNNGSNLMRNLSNPWSLWGHPNRLGLFDGDLKLDLGKFRIRGGLALPDFD